MSVFAFWFLLIIGLILLVSNTLLASKAGKPRDNPNYPNGAYYVIDAVGGLLIILIAFGVI